MKILYLALTLCLSLMLHGEEAPPLLRDLRQLQENVLPQNTSYRHRLSEVRWAGVNGSTTYVSHTDCSGLIDAVIEHTYHLDRRAMRAWFGRGHPKAKDYYRAILEQKGFIHIQNIQDVRPGDLIAIQFLPWAEDKARDTGHIMMVNQMPEKTGERKVDGQTLTEWAVPIIDSSHGHGKHDSRYRDGRYWPGLGKGTAALYTDSKGDILGYSWSTGDKSVYQSHENRPLVVGRVNVR